MRLGSIRPAVQLATSDRSMPYNCLIDKTLNAFPTYLIREFETLVIRIVDTEESREFNRRFRGVDRATNVLAFPPGVSAYSLPKHLGDILICAPLVTSEAIEYRIPPENRLIHLVAHGVLHLAGFDHNNNTNSSMMEKIEVAILGQIGIANPYEEQNSALDD